MRFWAAYALRATTLGRPYSAYGLPGLAIGCADTPPAAICDTRASNRERSPTLGRPYSSLARYPGGIRGRENMNYCDTQITPKIEINHLTQQKNIDTLMIELAIWPRFNLISGQTARYFFRLKPCVT